MRIVVPYPQVEQLAVELWGVSLVRAKDSVLMGRPPSA
jgi:hypothetical protein